MRMNYVGGLALAIVCVLTVACSSNDQATPTSGTGGIMPLGGTGISGSGGIVGPTISGTGGEAFAGGGSGSAEIITGGIDGAGVGGTAGVSGSDVGGMSGVSGAGVGGMSGVSGAGVGGMSGVSGAGVGGTAGDGGTAGTQTGPEIMGCDTTKLLETDGDTNGRGPWPVGEQTVQFGPFPAVDIMYPAKPGSEVGVNPLTFDVRTLLPDIERAKIPDSDNKLVSINTYTDLPIDDAHGPYPAVILMHGTASFRVASGSIQAHWASHGFIVMSADHPGLYIMDMIANCSTVLPAAPDTLSTDVDAEIAALANPTGQLAFLAGHVDASRIALSGHSAGACAVATYSNKPNVQVIMPLSGTWETTASSSLKSTLFVGGINDAVLPYYPGGVLLGSVLYPGTQTDAYNASPTKKRLLGISNAGHLNVTDLCQTNNSGLNSMEVMEKDGVGCLGIIPLLFDCGSINWEAGEKIVSDITTAVLEETLHCQDRAAVITNIKSRHPEVAELQEQI